MTYPWWINFLVKLSWSVMVKLIGTSLLPTKILLTIFFLPIIILLLLLLYIYLIHKLTLSKLINTLFWLIQHLVLILFLVNDIILLLLNLTIIFRSLTLLILTMFLLIFHILLSSRLQIFLHLSFHLLIRMNPIKIFGPALRSCLFDIDDMVMLVLTGSNPLWNLVLFLTIIRESVRRDLLSFRNIILQVYLWMW